MSRWMALAASAAVVAAGCGDSNDSDREEFVREVDALCAQANPELVAVNAALVRARDEARAGRASPRETFATFAAQLGRAAIVSDRFVARLRAIDPPAEEREFHRDLLAAAGEGAARVREQIAAAQRRDAEALRDLARKASDTNARTKGLISDHGGFRECGRA